MWFKRRGCICYYFLNKHWLRLWSRLFWEAGLQQGNHIHPDRVQKPIKLVVAPNGHFLLPLFNFNNQEMHDYIRTMGRLEPARTEPALAGETTAIPASEPEPGPAVYREIKELRSPAVTYEEADGPSSKLPLTTSLTDDSDYASI